MSLGLIAGLLTSVAWGVVDITAALSGHRVGSLRTLAATLGISVAVLRPRRDENEGVLVGRGRIELPQPKARVLQTLGLTTCPTDPRMVGMRGLEPLASAMRTRRSPS